MNSSALVANPAGRSRISCPECGDPVGNLSVHLPRDQSGLDSWAIAVVLEEEVGWVAVQVREMRLGRVSWRVGGEVGVVDLAASRRAVVWRSGERRVDTVVVMSVMVRVRESSVPSLTWIALIGWKRAVSSTGKEDAASFLEKIPGILERRSVAVDGWCYGGVRDGIDGLFC